ncbi:MAG: DNA recombination protein RmuC, partial [Thermodesulfobacteriota bacterium]
HVNKLGRDLDRCVGSFNQTVGSMEKRVMPAARRLQEMGAAFTDGKPLADVNPVTERPRNLNSGENDE